MRIRKNFIKDHMEVYYYKSKYDISRIILELDELENRSIGEDEDLDAIVEKHADEMVSKLVKDKYNNHIVYFMGFYFYKQLSKAFSALTEEECWEIANRDYDSIALSKLIGCILQNLGRHNYKLINRLLDRIPAMNKEHTVYVYDCILNIRDLPGDTVLKLRQYIVNGRRTKCLSDPTSELEDLEYGLGGVIKRFNEYIGNGDYRIKCISSDDVEPEDAFTNQKTHNSGFSTTSLF